MTPRVDLWIASLDVLKQFMDQFTAVLSRDELEDASKYRFEQLRTAALIRHGLLRGILSSYVAAPPETLTFEYGKHGKPSVKHHPRLHFNASDSGKLFVCAVTDFCSIGVDVEQLRPVEDAMSIARQFFSANECDALLGLSERDRDLGFLQCWTRKEAFVKATSEGLLRSLDSFEVSLRPGEEPRLLWLQDPHDDVSCWEIHSFRPATGYIGALAFRASGLTVTYRAAGVGETRLVWSPLLEPK